MRLLLAGFGSLLLMSCATPQSDDSLPPPATAAVTRITEADAGKVISVAVGQPFSVALVGVPTAGYLWKPVNPPAFLSVTGETGGPTTRAQTKPGFTGGDHWEGTFFTAASSGRGELRFEQRRPWEQNEPPADTFTVTIEAK